MDEPTYHGTYPVRKLYKDEHIIHMPSHVVGTEFAIYEISPDLFQLKAVGKKKKVVQNGSKTGQ
jgi:hypothetical protein